MSYISIDPQKPYHTTHSCDKPLNREPPIDSLVSKYITPNDESFDRNHGPIPYLSGKDHLLGIDGIVATPLALSIAELEEFPQHEVTCALTCAGNRRNTMGRLLKPVKGVGWNDGAVMNTKWTGPLLRDVLLRAGVTSPFSATSSAISNTTSVTELEGDDSTMSTDIRDSELHVWFYSNVVPTHEEDAGFGGSITLSRALDPSYEVILALRMNDEVLPVNHGFPIRVIVPGQLGARSVKWLDKITIAVEESFSHYQRRDYKVLPEAIETWDQAQGTDQDGDGVGVWPTLPSMNDMPINSVVGIPTSGSTVACDRNSCVEARGYGLPAGEDGPIVRVEVSGDEGKTWIDAELVQNDGGSKWCWTLWTAKVPMMKGQGRSIWSRATDLGGNTQKRFPKWNLRGVAYNGYGEARELTIN